MGPAPAAPRDERSNRAGQCSSGPGSTLHRPAHEQDTHSHIRTFRLQNGMSSSMSLLRPPPPAEATARRGGAIDGPLLPKSPPPPSAKLPPPPLRPSSMVSVELNPCSTTSVECFSTPL